MARNLFGEEYEFSDSPEFIMDNNPLDLGRYAHKIPTEENTDYIGSEINNVASSLENDEEMSDEQMGAMEASDDDALMAEIQKEQFNAGNLEMPDQIAIPPEMGGMTGFSAQALSLPNIQKTLESYNKLKSTKPSVEEPAKEESGLDYDRLALIAAAQKAGQSMAGRYSGNFKPDLEIIKMLQKRRSEKEAAARKVPQEQLKMLLDQYKLKKLMTPAPTKMKVSKDLTSADGQPLMTDELGNVYTMDRQPYEGEISRYTDPIKERQTRARERYLNIVEGSEKRKEKEAERRAEQFEFKKNETDKMRSEKIIKTLNDDAVTKTANAGIAAADKAETIIQKGGKMAPSVMGRLLARMAGEVGVMTDKDVEAFKGSAAWTDSMERFFQRGVAGTLTATDKAEMTNMVRLMRQENINAIEQRANVISGQFAVANNLEPDQIMTYLKPAIDVYRNALKGKGSDPKIEKYSKEHNLTYEQAEKILRSRGYGK